ncbi:TetR/AcrR family transcriptional regulator [Levilactobacillus suantsaii]|uniref:TetR/AcrR family transcriptional regulator n=1 Tax=Levilactobacillus suantsaii TaxID=2292255 RepID=UPI001F1755CA|nr:TetR/AcrR family transcriptional regulator [Levilactobacillus suantsaii]
MSREQYQLTDAKLVNNLFDLIADGQKLDGITVTQLCLKSGVARKTFYRHYSSTQKIIEGFLDNSANDFIGILKEAPVRAFYNQVSQILLAN